MESIYGHLKHLDDLKRQLQRLPASPKTAGLLTSIEETLQKFWKPGEQFTAVLVEPRRHRAVPFVIRNILENLDSRWNVQFFHGTKNGSWARRILGEVLREFPGRIQFELLPVEDLPSPTAYSRILASREFTERIPTEMFLVFQTDSMICPAGRHLIHKFLEFDYVGAPWPWDHLKVGNGGFSLRRKSKMLEIIDASPPYTGPFEDHFFSAGAPSVTLRKPSPEAAREFAIEQIYHPMSFGVHKVWAHQPPERLPALIKQCEGLKTLISLQSLDDGDLPAEG